MALNNKKTIGFIGGGNMASSLIGGLIADGYPLASLIVAEPDADKRAQLNADFQIETLADNQALVDNSDIVVLAVKPQVMAQVCQALQAPAATPLYVSIAAGIRSTDLDQWLGGGQAIVRSMPNTPALVGTGATGLYANPRVSNAQREAAESIMRAVGVAIWVDAEDDIDSVTAISGSGPAYYFLLMEMMENIAQEMGLSPANAHLLTLQTALGAAKMAIESSDPAAVLRQKVTSPGGTTEAALNSLEQGKIRELYSTALNAARQRSKELAEMLGQQ